MGKILDFIVGNTFVFIGVVGILVVALVTIVIFITKSLNKRKIPIYEELNENEEIDNAKDENVIETPLSKDVVEHNEVIEENPVVLESEDVVDKNIGLKEQFIIEENTFEDTEQHFDDELLREELEKIDDKEIEERIDEEHKKNIDDEIKDNDNNELKEILSGMKDTNEVDPDEVVRNFEEEQEAQSIISYQELVNAVKRRENDFEDELESRPLATVSDFIKKGKQSNVEPETNVVDMIQQLDKTKQAKEDKIEEVSSDTELEEIEVLEVVEPAKNEIEEEKDSTLGIPQEGKFKKTDVISPVFGRIQEKNKIDYPKVEKFERKSINKEANSDILPSVIPDFSKIEQNAVKKETSNTDIEEEMKSMRAMFEDISIKVEEKDRKAGNQDLEDSDDNIESLSAISKNEDFLRALRDFRDSL